MCGIAGVWSKNGEVASEALVLRMLSSLGHRGPDAQGIRVVPGLVLGHRRLKVLDLSDRANQPYTDGKDALVFNGEIFNYKDLRQELSRKYAFTTSCDTEVLFRALQEWGEGALQKTEGQFAFAFYSASSRSLLIARDHVGICPLYIRDTGEAFYFSSEIRPLLELDSSELDKQGVIDYFAYRYNIQNGRTLFKDIKRFPPAHFMKIDLNSRTSFQKRYWRLEFRLQQNSAKELQQKFNSLFNQEVLRQQAADVPVGLYLSGGIDSAALLAGFSKNRSEVDAFTLIFSGDDPEKEMVDALFRRHRFKSNEINFMPQDFSILDKAILALEEPFGDLIICANYLLAERASRVAKVVLSGEGGDESFCGYDHQRALVKMAGLSDKKMLCGITERLLTVIPSRLIAMSVSYPGKFGQREKEKMIKVLAMTDHPVEAYLEFISLFRGSELENIFSNSFKADMDISPDTMPIKDIFESEKEHWQALMRVEIEQLVLIINLLKQDRFAMHFSLEARVPLVSRRILEFAASLTYSEIFSKNTKKLLIGYAGSRPIKKRAFSILGRKEYISSIMALFDSYLTEETINEMGILAPEALSRIRSRIKDGGILAVKQAMSVLIFGAWWRQFKGYLR